MALLPIFLILSAFSKSDCFWSVGKLNELCANNFCMEASFQFARSECFKLNMKVVQMADGKFVAVPWESPGMPVGYAPGPFQDLIRCLGNSGQHQGRLTELQKRAEIENQCRFAHEQAKAQCGYSSFSQDFDFALEDAKKVEAGEPTETPSDCKDFAKSYLNAINSYKKELEGCTSSSATCRGQCQQSIVVTKSAGRGLNSFAQCGQLGATVFSLFQKNQHRIETLLVNDCSDLNRATKEVADKMEQLKAKAQALTVCKREISCAKSGSDCEKPVMRASAASVEPLETSRLANDLEVVDPKVSGQGEPLVADADALPPVPPSSHLGINSESPAAGSPSGLSSGAGGVSGAPTFARSPKKKENQDTPQEDKFERFRKKLSRSSSPSGYSKNYYSPPVKKVRGSKKVPALAKGFSLRLPAQFEDGITSANGPDLFTKVKNRYNIEKARLLD